MICDEDLRRCFRVKPEVRTKVKNKKKKLLGSLIILECIITELSEVTRVYVGCLGISNFEKI